MKRMRKSIIWMAAFMFCCGAVFAQKAERKNVREGNKFYETEKFTEAEIAYRKSLEVNPRSSEGTYNLGNALYKQKKFPEAAEQYQLLAGQGEKMIETPEGKARLAEIYHNVGNIGMQSKEYAKSVEAYKQSLRLNPKDDETRYNLALAQSCCTISRISRMKIKIRIRTRTRRKIRINRINSSRTKISNNSRMIRSRIRHRNNSRSSRNR